MAKSKAKKGKRETEKLEDDEIRTSNDRPDEEDCPSASHSRGKKKHKKSHMDPSNEDNPQKRKLNPIGAPKEEEEEVNDHKKKKMKKKKNIENEENKQNENDDCYLPGQKHDRPNERDPLRIFFEVLHQQLPECELAAAWMMEWGLLPPEDAMKVYERQLKEKQSHQPTSAATSLPTSKTSKISSRKSDKVSSNTKAKKRKASENTSADDLTLSKKKRKPRVSAS